MASLRDLIELYDREVTMLEGEIHRQLTSDLLPERCSTYRLAG